ncbi:aminotransferase [Pseudomaricurvus alkylphenolicus]|jgi:adenosylmethionine-8-amino-7-oxononanoate aminotransferase|uniref:aminotransferase n=1 Tax=Pseudomaricurvus alkylphenolicus TaxID=1306991 RepID=UPI001421B9A7|nr:aminotransferase [Pseudomaricurvus alkylphenolicus]NIB39937.1 aminotransferase [Pseudomaricurvus alkylphenolicus]
MTDYSTQQLVEKDKAHFTHPWTVWDVYNTEGALPIAKAEGAYIYDTDGNRYLDAVGGLWCNNIGTGRDEMAEAIAEQVKMMSYSSPFVDLTNVPATLLAEKLAQLAPGNINHVFYSCGGSTAVDTAFRLIHYYQNCRGKHDKKHIISRKSSYHGSTFAAMSIGGKAGDHPPEFDYLSDTIHHISAPKYYGDDSGKTEAEFLDSLVQELEDKILELGADKVAAFFAEPILGAGGVIVPPEGYHRRTWETCKKYDILYVSDEVVTAFGRLGHWFASEDVFGFQPDIITCAKGLTSGYQPLGATLYSDEIHNVISEEGHGRCFAHGFTYSGHPVACAAALKNIEIMEREQMMANVKELGPYFEDRLASLRDLPIVGDVRGKGFMWCVEFVANKENGELFPEELDIGKRISNNADKKGLIVRPIVHLNVMSPPLNLTREDIDFIVDTLRASIEETVAELNNEGYSL